MKNFNKDNKAGIRKKELEAWAEMSRKLDEVFDTLEQVNNNMDNIEKNLGILVESKKHKQEVR